jgi:carbonic anhydrase
VATVPDPLLERSHAQRAEYFERERDLLASLASTGQFPEAMFIACSDSRVVPESLMGARPGDLFVVRVVANIVPPYGTGQNSVGASVEYAVRYLNIKHLVVCGHLDCGGIIALDTGVDMSAEPALSNWIEFGRPAQTHVDAQGLTGHERHQAIVEANVLLQMENLRTYPAVRRALAGNRLELHAWVYDLANCQMRFYDADLNRFVLFSPTTSRATA